ncbi:polysaccharide biosynthesis/export family protein [Desulfuromonas acetoxidans]|uniref:Polysaccharide export protein n=1 Tax=Desulfuromonas acetoxidans (strain DSM 684 / 11070) TaxID=281689 RepID=Q1K3Z3_DESA6|nr:polysaccharide biosynthesis/export family protein [Desulfuromonas acetoxidans]EAT17310.1 polysaccharide export protein [Desulfuromonas acetoxidans DSM 684]MBF0644305.1 polysaccharide biosynthesis/export family protein [Desulfuromonas acetoxidans]NVD26226.1 polysaccharide biosynthesis/export family protein [Desulfuromonas acetoxidans]NVE15126.1 polysaccharide biosynthesis/export family protein [Desulfuromonas acetoxidans]
MKRIFWALMFLVVLATPVWSADYVVGAGDNLSVSVWGVPELSVAVAVRPDGKITLPAVGDVEASGRTPSQLSTELTNVLSDYVKNPIVTVTVAQVTNNRIYISGGGVPAQVRHFVGSTSLFKLLCGLEGIENADLQRGFVQRGKEKLTVDMYDLFNRGNLEADIDLEAEDILFLPTNELNKVYVVGAVANPQAIVYRDGLSILDAILESGGFTKFAKTSAVLILRKQGEKRERIKLNMDDLMEDGVLSENIPMQRGDYVLVREGMF